MTAPLHDRPLASPRHRGLRPGPLALALCVGLAPLPLHAGPDSLPAVTDDPAPPADDSPTAEDQVDRAMSAYTRGTQNYNLAQYDAALADFKEAASLYASPDFQYNIALCYEKLEKPEEAVRAYATYLKAKPNAEDRPNVENRIRELQEEIKRREQAKKDAQTTPPPTVITPPPPTEDEPPKSGKGLIITGATLTGLGAAAALGGGIGFGVLASESSFLVDEIQTGGNPQGYSFAEAQQFEEQGKRDETIQIAMVAAGATVAVTGAVLLALGLRQRKAFRAAGDEQAWLRPSITIGRHAGLSLQGRF